MLLVYVFDKGQETMKGIRKYEVAATVAKCRRDFLLQEQAIEKKKIEGALL